MNRTRRLWPLWLLVALAPIVHADEPKGPAKKPAASTTPPPPRATSTAAADDELLEFLGSVGEEADGDWIDYLSKTDIAKVSGAKEKPPTTAEVSAK